MRYFAPNRDAPLRPARPSCRAWRTAWALRRLRMSSVSCAGPAAARAPAAAFVFFGGIAGRIMRPRQNLRKPHFVAKMSQIISRWLNDDLKLSRIVGSHSARLARSAGCCRTPLTLLLADAAEFAPEFSNGYLFGEILARYGFQVGARPANTISSNGRPTLKTLPTPGLSLKQSALPDRPHSLSSAKLGNFMLLEPSLAALGVPLSTSMVRCARSLCHAHSAQARDIMEEKPGAAAKLAYQLFVIFNKKTPAQPALDLKVGGVSRFRWCRHARSRRPASWPSGRSTMRSSAAPSASSRSTTRSWRRASSSASSRRCRAGDDWPRCRVCRSSARSGPSRWTPSALRRRARSRTSRSSTRSARPARNSRRCVSGALRGCRVIRSRQSSALATSMVAAGTSRVPPSPKARHCLMSATCHTRWQRTQLAPIGSDTKRIQRAVDAVFAADDNTDTFARAHCRCI